MPKISELNEISSLYANDYIAVAHDLGGLPSTKKINVVYLASSIATNAPYANSTSAGVLLLGGDFYSNATGYLQSSAATVSNTGLINQFLLADGTGGTYWSNNPGLDAIVIENYSNNYIATVNDNYIFCDPNDINQVITVVLPSNGPEGKEYNIKNLNGIAGQNYVTVTTDDPAHRLIENPETGLFVNSYDIYNRGDMQTWIHDGSSYRHTGSQTGAPTFITSANSYSQVVIKNTNSGNNASADLVVYSDQADYTAGNGPFIDMGIDSSTYSNPAYAAFGPNDAYLYTGNSNLIVGTSTSNTTIKFLAGNTDANAIKMTINSTAIAANTNIPFLADTVSVTNMRGPYSNDTAAATGGVPVKGLYYDSSGIVHIRLV